MTIYLLFINSQLVLVIHVQVKMDLECRALELQSIAAATQVDAVKHAEARRRHYETVLPKLLTLQV